MRNLVLAVAVVLFGFMAFWHSSTPYEPYVRGRGEVQFTHTNVIWGNGQSEAWPHKHQRVVTQEHDWELAAYRFNLPIVPLPVVFVYTLVGEDEIVPVQVNSVSDGKLLWSK